MLLPIMASRLMLSVKRATAEPAGLWSLSTMAESGREKPSESDTVQFVPQMFGVSCESPEDPTPPNEAEIELDPLPQTVGSQE